jgi:DNA end-binding protein Ku
LRETLTKTHKVALARVVLHTRQYLAALMPLESAMVLVKLRWPAEVRSLDELALGPDVTKAELAKGELDMAKRLVEDMSVEWSPEDYRDEFEDKIMALVDKKAHEGKIEDVETATGEEERKTAQAQPGGQGGEQGDSQAQVADKAGGAEKSQQVMP